MKATDTMASWRRAEIASAYVEGVRGAIPLIEAQIDLLHRFLDATLPSIGRLIDLGCGDGALAATVLERHPAAEAILIDFSRPMLARAGERFTSRSGKVTLVEADLATASWLEALPSSPAYDLVLSGFAIHHLQHERKRELFAEVLSLLRPGGVFINLEHVAPMSDLTRSLFDELFIDNLHQFALASDPQASRAHIAAGYHGRDDQHDNVLAPVEAQLEWMREAGFGDVDCYFKVLEIAMLAGRREI